MQHKQETCEQIKQTLIETKLRRSNMTCKAFELKVQMNKLTKKQEECLKMQFVEAKWLWNHILSWSETEGNKPWLFEVGKSVTHKDKHGNKIESELKYLGSTEKQDIKKALCSAIKTLSTLKKRGQHIGRLKYKSEITAINLHRFGKNEISKNNKILLPKVGRVKVSGLEQIVNKGFEIANAKLLNRSDGYYLKVTTYQNKVEQIYKGDEIGIDLGVSTTVTLSDGRKFNASVEESERLKRLQRKFAKQVKGSNNRRKTLRKIKIEYQKLTNKKNDLANKIVHEIKQYKNIYMQDENLTGWKIRFGKTIQHSVLGRVKAKLVDQAYVLDRFVPTTKACYNCGQIHEIPLSQRTFTCDCDIVPEDRDVHAAKNMIALAKLGCKVKSVPVVCRDLSGNAKKSVELGTSTGAMAKVSSELGSRKTLKGVKTP